MIDFIMTVIFTVMFVHFIKNKKKSMNDRLARWKCKHTLSVIMVFSLVLLSVARTVVKVITMHGFLGDTHPNDYTEEDYKRALYDYGFSSFTDFVISMAILRLIFVKN